MPVITILGIDPGSRITGYGVVRMDGPRAVHLGSGCIRVAELDVPERLKRIFEELTAIVKEYGPDHVAIEKIFMSRNADSALKLGQARGTAIVACARSELPIFEYSATQIKQAIVGRGHAGKQQVQHMIKALLCLPEAPAADAADALAAALCHGHTDYGSRGIRAARIDREGPLR
ncbi:MAG: crossover junction endodeoxyribonuclease RuvC [Gammaproteobacteria bacterium]|nr:crossover junction endodeoxyribonuclease RuvC [Gammaproteobacteria bacterium]HJP35291.1 crossover junction endodeoxyribonuclease RuvC [Gammaproteobacteria bacterium]